MLYVYGIVDAREIAPISKIGHGDAEVFAVPCEDLAAAVSVVARPEIPPTPENLWRHERVLEALMAGHTVLPHRFGTIASDDRMLAEHLWRIRKELGADFERVRGKVELAVRIATAARTHDGEEDGHKEQFDNRPPALGMAATERKSASVPTDWRGETRLGTDYLESRRAAERRAQDRRSGAVEIQRSLRGSLDPLSVEACWRLPEVGAEPIKVAFLVQRSRVAAFAEAVRDVRRTHPEVVIGCTGPWPPYSFITTCSNLEKER